MKLYVIQGNPVALSRPRMSKKVIYDPQKNQKFFDTITISSQHGQNPLLQGPLHLDVVFYMPISASKEKAHKSKLCSKSHIFKPDLDNLIKYIGDICNKTIYDDDCIISSITARKIYDAVPRTEFSFRQIA